MTDEVVGRYCPTDANPETEAADEETREVCATRAEVESLLLWYPGGRIVESDAS